MQKFRRRHFSIFPNATPSVNRLNGFDPQKERTREQKETNAAGKNELH